MVLGSSDVFDDVITKGMGEEVFVPAGTGPEDAIPVEVCLDAKHIYGEDCLFWGLFCEQSCEGAENVIYEGKITASRKILEEVRASGSSTSFGVAVPLSFSPLCSSYGRDWTVAYITVILVVVILIGVILYQRHKRNESF